MCLSYARISFPNKGTGLVCYGTVGALNGNWLFKVILDSGRTYSTRQIDFKLFREFFPDNLLHTIGFQKSFVILIPQRFKIKWYKMRKLSKSGRDRYTRHVSYFVLYAVVIVEEVGLKMKYWFKTEEWR